MTTITTPFSGGCACGAIRYESTAEPAMMLHCHCRHCQRASGGPFSSYVIVPKEAFKLTESNGVWSEQVLVNFANGPLGGQPDTGLVLDGAGNLYGVSFSGGQFDAGLVYEISNL